MSIHAVDEVALVPSSPPLGGMFSLMEFLAETALLTAEPGRHPSRNSPGGIVSASSKRSRSRLSPSPRACLTIVKRSGRAGPDNPILQKMFDNLGGRRGWGGDIARGDGSWQPPTGWKRGFAPLSVSARRSRRTELG